MQGTITSVTSQHPIIGPVYSTMGLGHLESSLLLTTIEYRQ